MTTEEPVIHWRRNNGACGDPECCGPNYDYIVCNIASYMVETFNEGINFQSAEPGEHPSFWFSTEKEEVTCPKCLR